MNFQGSTGTPPIKPPANQVLFPRNAKQSLIVDVAPRANGKDDHHVLLSVYSIHSPHTADVQTEQPFQFTPESLSTVGLGLESFQSEMMRRLMAGVAFSSVLEAFRLRTTSCI